MKNIRTCRCALSGTVALAVLGSLLLLAAPSQSLAACSSDPAPGVDWSDCRKRNLVLTGSDLKGADLSGADLSSTDLRNSYLGAVNFQKANLLRASMANSNIPDADFSKALGYRCDFRGANLINSDFSKSEMQRADFTNADLTGVDFSKSDLGRVGFDGANLTGTRFTSANVARTDFTKAVIDGPIDFSGAYLFQIRIEGLDLAQWTGLEQWQIDMACGDDGTILPSGLSQPASWPCGDDD